MEAEELLDWLAPPVETTRSPQRDGSVSPIVEAAPYFHPPRRCRWSFAVVDHRHRLALPMPEWAGLDLVMVASAGSLLLAEWRWYSGKSSVAVDESLDSRADSRCRVSLCGAARAHLDAHAGDPIAIGVEEAAGRVVHLVGPARFERALGGWQ